MPFVVVPSPALVESRGGPPARLPVRLVGADGRGDVDVRMAAVALDDQVSRMAAGQVLEPEQKAGWRPLDAVEVLCSVIGPLQFAASVVGHPEFGHVPGQYFSQVEPGR